MAEQISVRGFDPQLWRRIRAEALRHNVGSAELLNTIVSEWIAQHQCADERGPLEPIERDN